MDVRDAVRLRRSIKPECMKPDPVEPALIDRLLEAANWAPSHGHTEPWRFVVFTGPARRELGEALLRAMGAMSGTPIGPKDPRRKKLRAKVDTAPVIVAIVCAVSPSKNIFEHEEIASTAMAVQNMHIVARAEGLGAFWSSGKKAFHPEMASFLDLAEHERCLGIFYVGWPARPWPDGDRRPIADKVKYRSS